MFCEQCGAQVPDGMRFCDQCGAPVPDIQSGMQTQQGYMSAIQQPMPAMKPGYQAQPEGRKSNVAQKKSLAVPVIIAVAAVLVLGLGGFGAYKAYNNFDKLKGMLGKEEPVEPPVEDDPGNVPDNGRGTEGMTQPGNRDTDGDKKGNGNIDEDKPEKGNINEDKPGNENKDGTKDTNGTDDTEGQVKEKSSVEENRPDIGDVWDYDTSEKPVWEDFEWMLWEEMNQGVLNGDDVFGEKAYRLTAYDDIIGGWKGYICYDPENTYDKNPWGGPMVFLIHAEISGQEDNPIIYVDWLQSRNTFNGEEEELTTKGMFECTRKGSIIYGEQDNGWKMTLEHFCWLDGHEYATGTMKAADGGDCILALSRP